MKSLYGKTALFLLSAFLFLFSRQAMAMTVSYEQKVSVNNNVIATVKVLTRDETMRAESDFNGMKTVMFRNPKGLFSYLPSQNIATQIPASLDRPNLTRDIPKFKSLLDSYKAEKIGEEKFGDYDCEVYSYTEPMLQKPAKAWLWKEKSFPVKIEVDAPEGMTRIEIVNINFAPAVNDKDFEVPESAKMVTFNAPGAQGEGVPQRPGAAGTKLPDLKDEQKRIAEAQKAAEQAKKDFEAAAQKKTA